MSSKPPTWKTSFERGVAYYKLQEYDKAVQAFDKAVRLGGRRVIVCDSRAAALEKLGRLKEALQDARAVIELDPNSPKGFIRASHLFDALGSAPKAHQALLAAIPLSSPDARSALQAKLVFLDTKLDAHHRSRVNHIQRLPSELLLAIGHLLVAARPDVGFALAGVDRSWRDLFLGDRRMWGRLRLKGRGKGVSVQRVQRAIERSQGAFVELALENVDSTLMVKIVPLLSSSLALVQDLRLHHFLPLLLDASSWRGRLHSLRKVSIDFGSTSDSVGLVFALLPPGHRALRSLDTDVFRLPRPSENEGQFYSIISGLKHLGWRSLSSGDRTRLPDATTGLVSTWSSCGTTVFSESEADNLDPRIYPNMERVLLKEPMLYPRSRPISLPALRHLEVDRASQSSVYRFYLFPDLSSAGVRPLPLLPSPSALLRHLALSRCVLNTESLLADLPSFPCIIHLSLSGSSVSDAFVQGLIAQPSSPPLLPLLEHLDLSGTQGISSGSVVKLVASRLGSVLDRPSAALPSALVSLPAASTLSEKASSATDLEGDASSGGKPAQVARLKVLLMDECAGIEEAADKWLRSKLDRFANKVTWVR